MMNMLLRTNRILAVSALGATTLAACTDSQSTNAAFGALIGAAVGNQIGEGDGKTLATLGGAAAGAAIGSNARR
jgi:uncharacterized protein YcfJ